MSDNQGDSTSGMTPNRQGSRNRGQSGGGGGRARGRRGGSSKNRPASAPQASGAADTGAQSSHDANGGPDAPPGFEQPNGAPGAEASRGRTGKSRRKRKGAAGGSGDAALSSDGAGGDRSRQEDHERIAQAAATAVAKLVEQGVIDPDDQDGDENDNACPICTEDMVFASLGECDHRVCHVCSLRLRALYKNKHCPYCKTEMDHVVMTGDHTKPFAEFPQRAEQLPYHDSALGIYFETQEAYAAALSLLRFNCPDPTCTHVVDAGGWAALKSHVREKHGMLMCDICTDHKKIFAHEHSLYPPNLISQHRSQGDLKVLERVVNPDPSFVKGHPDCGFCHVRFFGNDELFTHCRHAHEECFLCQRAGVHNVYYANYTRLEEHFGAEHFPCMHPDCLDHKFVVFASALDLQVHEADAHPLVGAQRSQQNRRLALEFQYAGDDRRPKGGREGRKERGKNKVQTVVVPTTAQAAPASSSGSGAPLNAAGSSLLAAAAGPAAPQPPATGNEPHGKGKGKGKKKSAQSDGGKCAQQQQQQQQQQVPSSSAAAPPPVSAPADNSTRPSSGQARSVRAPAGFGQLTTPSPSSAATKGLGKGSAAAAAAAAAASGGTAGKLTREADEDRAIAASPLLTSVFTALGSSRAKLREFQSMSAAYMAGHITAPEFVQSLAQLFSTAAGAGSATKLDAEMVRQIVATCPDAAKRDALQAELQDLIAPSAEEKRGPQRVLVIRPGSPSTVRAGPAPGARKPGWSYILPQNRLVRAQTAKRVKSVWNVPPPAASSAAPSTIAGFVPLASAATGKGKGKAPAARQSAWGTVPGSGGASSEPSRTATPTPPPGASAATATSSRPASASSTVPAAPAPAPSISFFTSTGPKAAGMRRNEKDYPALPSTGPAPRSYATAAPAAGAWSKQGAPSGSDPASASSTQGSGKGKKNKNLLFRVGL